MQRNVSPTNPWIWVVLLAGLAIFEPSSTRWVANKVTHLLHRVGGIISDARSKDDMAADAQLNAADRENPHLHVRAMVAAGD